MKKALNLGAIVIGVRKTISALSKMNDESVNYVETLNLFNVSMGKGIEGLNQYYEKALNFQNKLEEKLGTNIEESMQYQALFNSMSKSMGISAKYAYTLSENFTKLGYDLASLYNIDPENAMQKLRAGLAGQTKPLRDLGLDITQQSLQPIVEELGIKNSKGATQSVKNMSQAEKMILRYIAVLKQAQVAQGDFATTMESPANQLRIFNAQITAFKRNMGNLWQGVLGGILPYVNAIMMVINEILKMIAKLFGFKVSEQKVNISADIGADDLADDLGTASGKAKELKNQLMGFDEINNISLETKSSSGTSGTTGTGIDQRLLDAMKEYDNLMDKVSNKATTIRDKILDWLGFTRDLNGDLKWSWKNMNSIAKITSIIGGADNVINSAFNGLIDMCFNSENYLTTNFGSSVINFSNLKALILSLSISLIVLKFLKKGFDMYVMWTDGESDTPPLTYIVYFIRAIVVAVSFSVLYDWVIQVATSFGNSILTAMNFTDNVSLTTAIANVATTGLFTAIVALIAMILLFVLYIQFLMRSLEMFVLKLGFPLACVGLVNPDGGVFKSYSEKLFKSVLTVLVQGPVRRIFLWKKSQKS